RVMSTPSLHDALPISAELRAANGALEAEIAERKRAEAELRRSEAQLAIAQKIASIGSWEWDLLTNDLTWSEENFRIHGFEPHTLDRKSTRLNSSHVKI